MPYYEIVGANLFGQWLAAEQWFPNFRKVCICNPLKSNYNSITLVDANWSYNIFLIDNDYYITGSSCGYEKQFAKIDLPEECSNMNRNDLILAGNDYELVIVSKVTKILWVLNLENINEIKKFVFYSQPSDADLKMEPSVDDEIESISDQDIESNADLDMEPSPKRFKKEEEDTVIKVVVTNSTYLFLTSEGNVYCGVPPPPTLLNTKHCYGKVCDIHSGYEHCVLLTDKGRIYTWGNGRRLQLGHGDLKTLENPTEIEALAGITIVKICTGGWHSLALTDTGDLYAWGWNDSSQLGIKQEGPSSYSLPTLVDLFDENGEEVLINVVDMACGSKHSAILLEDGTVWMTGYNKYGQLRLPPEREPVVHYFKKTYQCTKDITLRCAPWSTIISYE